MTASPGSLIATSGLPLDASCTPVLPHRYLRVNTVFEVARAAGMRTAWSDKHPAYEILNGPSGSGIQDLFTPEINSNAPDASSTIDWTKDNALTQQYDGYKVQAVLNEIDGYDHGRTAHVGVPAIFGMNFQTVSTAEKLPASDGLAGGYLADAVTPGPLLTRALDFVDTELGAMVAELRAQHLASNTVVVVSAKHGQSPMDLAALDRIDDGTILDALNAAWQTAHPAAAQPLVAFSVDDDAMLIWLNDRSSTATDFARGFLAGYSGTSVDGKPFTSSGLVPGQIHAGPDAATYFHTTTSDPRVPDILGVAQYGVVYTGKKAKIAEHGGSHAEDTHVPLVVAGAGLDDRVVTSSVETTQIAPTILSVLGLDPHDLQAVRIEGTQALP